MDPVALLQEPQDAILLETTQDLGRAVNQAVIERVDEVDTLQEVVANIGFNDVLPSRTTSVMTTVTSGRRLLSCNRSYLCLCPAQPCSKAKKLGLGCPFTVNRPPALIGGTS